MKAIRRDMDAAQDYAIQQWAALPVQRQNGRLVNRSFYEYLIDLNKLREIVAGILQRTNGRGKTVTAAQTQQAYRNGTAKAVENLSRLSDDYTREVTSYLMSDPVMRRAALAGGRVFEYMEGFNADTAADLGRVLFQAVQDGQNPRDTEKVIRQRFGIAKRRAERIARTEITGALRRGRIDEARDAEDKFGIRVKMLWYSALIPERSRLSHMRRHGHLYTMEEVTEFYETGGNAINCLCSQTEVTLGDDGEPVFGKKLIERMTEARERVVG
jgi:SPP1 gp7 family putative phage head morphogenesis protein